MQHVLGLLSKITDRDIAEEPRAPDGDILLSPARNCDGRETNSSPNVAQLRQANAKIGKGAGPRKRY